MREFKIEPDEPSKKRDARVRLLMAAGISSPVVVFVALLFVRSLHRVELDSELRWLLVLSVLGAVICAYWMAISEAFRRARRQMVFLLGDHELIRRREGWPEEKILFSEIKTVYDWLGTLVVESTEPLRRISVPKEVKGFEVIRAELAKQFPIATEGKIFRAKPTWTSVVVRIVTVLSWSALLVVFYYVFMRRR